MPGDPKNPGSNRPIYSELKSKKIVFEPERPARWPFMKFLRENSKLKEFYPEISPYHEAYKVRDNTWAIFTDTFDGAGDPWMYLIDGPEKALLIDTGFGVGDLKGLAKKLINNQDKEIIVANTHFHYDHAYGNAQFDDVYCHEDEVHNINSIMNGHIWDYLYDHETMKGIYTEFDPKDIIPFKEYNVHPLKSYECIDLGEGYLVECVPLRGHSAGQSGWLDHQTHCLFTGDTGGAGRTVEGEPHPENCTIERLRDDFRVIVSRIDEVGGVFPGHGPLDQTPVILKYTLNACEWICNDPEKYDEINARGQCTRYIFQGTSMKYTPEKVYMKK